MFIRQLKIHNIASIEDAEINFVDAPIGESDVFLITGKTGSGKTTILDSICLALYDTTARMSGTMIQGSVEDDVDKLAVNDERQMLRRNTSEGFVELLFDGNNGLAYRATWSVARAHNKTDGKIQSRQWQLENLSNGSILNKVKEVEKEIKSAVGLDFAQFCRTTLLAQGEFTRFLNSKDEDKSDILEKMTGTQLYSDVGKMIFKLTKEKDLVCQKLKEQISFVSILTDTECEDLIQQLNNLQLAILADDRERKKKEDVLLWMRTYRDIKSHIDELQIQVASSRQIVESDEFKSRRAVVADWKNTEAQRTAIRDLDDARGKKEQIDRHFEELHKKFVQLLKGIVYRRDELVLNKKEVEDLTLAIACEEKNKSLYDNWQYVVACLETIQDARNQISKESKQIELCDKRISGDYLPKTEQMKAAIASSQEIINKESTELRGLEEQLNAKDAQSIRLQSEECLQKKHIISNITLFVQQLHAEQKRYEVDKNRCDELRATVESHKNEIKSVEARLQSIETLKSERKRIVESLRDGVDKWAQSMRATLHVGDDCPVCRQKITQVIPLENEIQSFYLKSKSDYDEAVNSYGETEKKHNTLLASLDAKEKELGILTERLADTTGIVAVENKILDLCLLLNLNGIESVQTDVPVLEEQNERRFEQLRLQLKEIERLEIQIREKHKNLELNRNGVEKMQAELSSVEKHIEQLRQTIVASQHAISLKTDEQERAIAEVDTHCSGSAWENKWNDNMELFKRDLRAAVDDFTRKQERKNRLSDAVVNHSEMLKSIDDIVGSILSKMPAWREENTTSAEAVPHLLERANEISAEVAGFNAMMETINKKVKDGRRLIEDFLAFNPHIDEKRIRFLSALTLDDVRKIETQTDDTLSELATRQQVLANYQKQKEQHLLKKPFFEDGETENGLSEKIANIEEHRKSLILQSGMIQERLDKDRSDRAKVAGLTSKYGELYADLQRWQNLNSLIGSADGKKFRNIAQSYILSNLIHSANGYMKALTDRYELSVIPGSFVIMVSDAYQGYSERAVSTVSGGESFLISLALALALGDIGQQLSSNILLIDEGFGTLSGEPLQNAINTLRSLHTKSGRHVGIISHVEELRDSIPVQIRLEQEGHHSSSRVDIVTI